MTDNPASVRVDDRIAALERRIALLESKLQAEPALHIQYVTEPDEYAAPPAQEGEKP